MGTRFLLGVILPFLIILVLGLLVIHLAIGRRGRATTRERALLILITGCLGIGGLVAWHTLYASRSTVSPSLGSSIPNLPPLVSDPPDAVAIDTMARLDSAVIPTHDPVALRSLLASDTLMPTPPIPPRGYQVGDRHQFILHTGRTVQAELVHAVEHVNVWLVVDAVVERQTLIAAADRLENTIFPAVRRHFGFERSPGAYGVPISILHYEDSDDGMGGFFAPNTGVFYINLAHKDPGQEDYFATLAHEFQHMVHWHNDRNEERWLNEGFSELAERLAGFDPGWNDEAFREEFDTQLNHWPEEKEGVVSPAHYGASYRFALYLWEQFGDEFIWDLAHHPANGMASVDAVLAAHESDLTADEVFANWVVANAVDEGEYAYTHEDWYNRLVLWLSATFYRYPVSVETVVHPYATDYFELVGQDQVFVRFSGLTQTRLLPVAPHSGQTCWWSNVGHQSNARLVRRFDLSDLSQATLRFWIWYDLEEEKDYVYLSVSGDGGQTWETFPAGGDYGYTGQSSGWVEVEVNLNRYVGGEVRVRFDYVTDHRTQGKGFLLDDVSIPELDLIDPCEEAGDWQAEGFVLVGPVLPVRWLVQIIEVPNWGQGTLGVRRMPLDGTQIGEMELHLSDEVRTLLAISALVRSTTQPVTYRCEITRR